MPPNWRLALSIHQLMAQVNAAAPRRNRAFDGTIGDAAHQATKSDHNPNAKGVVTAVDFTDDPKGGLSCQRLVDALVRSKDPRIKYIIWKGQIISSVVSPWKWRPYKGPNPHSKHLHLSVDPVRYDETQPWNLLGN